MEEAFENGTVSIGGMFIGLSIIVWTVIRWWRQTEHDWRELVFPFVPLMLYGMLLILSAGGILGSIANFSLWGSNHVGRVALEYGVGGTDSDITRSTNIVLDDGGHLVVMLLTVGFLAWAILGREARGEMKKVGWIRKIWVCARVNIRLITPVIAGTCLGLLSGLAGLTAQGLGPGVDTLGALIMGIR